MNFRKKKLSNLNAERKCFKSERHLNKIVGVKWICIWTALVTKIHTMSQTKFSHRNCEARLKMSLAVIGDASMCWYHFKRPRNWMLLCRYRIFYDTTFVRQSHHDNDRSVRARMRRTYRQWYSYCFFLVGACVCTRMCVCVFLSSTYIIFSVCFHIYIYTHIFLLFGARAIPPQWPSTQARKSICWRKVRVYDTKNGVRLIWQCSFHNSTNINSNRIVFVYSARCLTNF